MFVCLFFIPLENFNSFRDIISYIMKTMSLFSKIKMKTSYFKHRRAF